MFGTDLEKIMTDRKNRPPTVVQPDGTQEWHDSDGNPHRMNGPAVICLNGDEEWHCHGKWHRVGGPAITLYSNDGTVVRDQFYFQNDRLHREDGPAFILGYDEIEIEEGNVDRASYYINIICREFSELFDEGDLNIQNLFREGVQIWFRNYQIHRSGNLPAIIFPNGVEEYWVNNNRHREDGPWATGYGGQEEFRFVTHQSTHRLTHIFYCRSNFDAFVENIRINGEENYCNWRSV